MPLEQSWGKSERIVPMSEWPFAVKYRLKGQRRTGTPREKETYAIMFALRKWSGHFGLQPIVLFTDHQSLRTSHKEHVDVMASV